MNKEFVPYEQALALKELGFDEPCFSLYSLEGSPNPVLIKGESFTNTDEIEVLDSNECAAPLYQQAFRFFREEYNLLPIVNIDLSDNLKDKVHIYSIEDHLGSIVDRSEEYNTYEEAELACLRKLIEIVNQNKDGLEL